MKGLPRRRSPYRTSSRRCRWKRISSGATLYMPSTWSGYALVCTIRTRKKEFPLRKKGWMYLWNKKMSCEKLTKRLIFINRLMTNGTKEQIHDFSFVHVSERHNLIVLSFSSAAEAMMLSVGWQAVHRTTSTQFAIAFLKISQLHNAHAVTKFPTWTALIVEKI